MTEASPQQWNATSISVWRKEHPNIRINLSGADLSSANLGSAYLGGADLSGADLSGADLSGADLSGANLSRANLSGADLSSADLSSAYLSRAYLSRANLSGADLSSADLSSAYLSRADLGDTRISQYGPCGSRKDYLVIKQGPNLDEVMTGCFRGTLDEFEAAVDKTHGTNQYGLEYRAIISLIRHLMEINAMFSAKVEVTP